jgi:Na+/phosphate symporter
MSRVYIEDSDEEEKQK